MAKRDQIYEQHTHKILWASAKVNFNLAEKDINNRKYLYLSSMVMQFFAFEAYLNYIGVLIADDVWAREREFFSREPFQGTLGKYVFLAKLLLLPKPNFSRGNGQVLKLLNEIRDTAAHGRLHAGSRSVNVKPGYPVIYTPSELERKTTKKYAERGLNIVECVANELQQEAIKLYPEKNIVGAAFDHLIGFEITDVK